MLVRRAAGVLCGSGWQGMKDLNWDQEAGLSRISFSNELDGWPFPMGEDVAQGTLREMLSLYLEFTEDERSRMTITIAGGFHVDGCEIDALVNLSRRQRGTPWDS